MSKSDREKCWTFEKNAGKVTETNPAQKLTFLHCIIDQEVLCKSVLKMNHVVEAVTKIVNFIREKSITSQFVALLEENGNENCDISCHCIIRWLSLAWTKY